MTDFSIIIVSFNTCKLLLDCLQSIYTQVSGNIAEIWVVDNASTDGSPDAVRQHFPGVNLIENRENVGFGKANNQAMRQAAGKVWILLNPDTIIQPGVFENLQTAFTTYPNAGVIAPQLLNADGSVQPSYGQFSSIWTEFFFQFFLYLFLPSPFPLGKRVHWFQRTAYETAHPVPWATGACLAVRREAVEKTGFLSESIFMYGEDMEWAWRFHQNGYQVVFFPPAKIIHLAQQASKMDFCRWITNYTRGQLGFIRQHRSVVSTKIACFLILSGSVLRLFAWALIKYLSQNKKLEASSRLEGYRIAFKLGWNVLKGGLV